jgi:transcriptional regulator with XRE-family HTH domain
MYHAAMSEHRSIIAERVEELLRLRGITVAQLSRASELSESSISNILSGFRRQPRSDTVTKLAKGLKTSTGYLNGETSDYSHL